MLVVSWWVPAAACTHENRPNRSQGRFVWSKIQIAFFIANPKHYIHFLFHSSPLNLIYTIILMASADENEKARQQQKRTRKTRQASGIASDFGIRNNVQHTRTLGKYIIIIDALFLATFSLVHGNVYTPLHNHIKPSSSDYKIYMKQCFGFYLLYLLLLLPPLLACSISFAPIHIGA